MKTPLKIVTSEIGANIKVIVDADGKKVINFAADLVTTQNMERFVACTNTLEGVPSAALVSGDFKREVDLVHRKHAECVSKLTAIAMIVEGR